MSRREKFDHTVKKLEENSKKMEFCRTLGEELRKLHRMEVDCWRGTQTTDRLSEDLAPCIKLSQFRTQLNHNEDVLDCQRSGFKKQMGKTLLEEH